MKRYYIYALTGLLMMSACTEKDKQEDAEKQLTAIEKQKVTATTTAELRSVDDELILNGDVSCDETLLRKIYIPCTGRVSGMKIEIGDYVSAGQCLATIHSEGAADYRKSIANADADIRIAEREYRMQKDMHASGMASDKDLEEAKERMLIAKTEKQRLHDVAAINGYNGKSNASLSSPISGYIINKRIYNDSYVSDDNNDDPAIEIADLRRVWIIADVYESDIAKIKLGAKADVTTMAFPESVFHGKIDKIYSVLDNESKTMKIRISLANPKGQLKPGMFANVHVRLSGNGKAMPAVPSSAVVFENGHDYVMVETNPKKYKRQEIEVAQEANGIAYISQGLQGGEKVITKNALLYFNASGNE